MSGRWTAEPGRAHPLGATPDGEGVNFSVFSDHGTAVRLLLFEHHAQVEPSAVFDLDPVRNRTFAFWHIYVRGLKPGSFYAYRVDGPRDPAQGHRFNPGKVLIDPYARGNSSTLWDRVDACGEQDNLATSMRSVVIDAGRYDWEGDRPLNLPREDLVIYELHVGGFTRSPTSGVRQPGKFLGLVEKIPYLKELGVTAVELLPVQDFDDSEILRVRDDGVALRNYWGYSTVGFFSPDEGYCVRPEEGAHLDEFRDMVKAFHRAGIEVILDVVFNHTNEGNDQGPTFSFRGFDNSVYYFLVPWDRRYCMDYSGCGNTVNCNHPIVAKFIRDCLEFWVEELHVDGFRFDEGSILSRGEEGGALRHAPVLWDIELSETLADTKLIAESWDAGGLFEVGSFPGYRWAEWNGLFRDDVRRFVKGDPGLAGAVATRIAGSADIYSHDRHCPLNSLNFVTCHDGFTLMDLVSYNGKHNHANGEGNRDGIDDNLSWNCGEEGETRDAGILAFRKRQIRNFLTILLVSQGTPMLLGGDEAGRTQRGNNNAYCQDNGISWFDWGLTGANADLLRFTRGMIAFRRRNASLRRTVFFSGAVNERGLKDVAWHGCRLNAPGWNDPSCRVLAFTLGSFTPGEPDLHVMLNMATETLAFELPAVPGRQWRRFVDTALAAPDDLMPEGREIPIDGQRYLVTGRSAVILVAV